jgi:hypothetical protein
MINYTLVLYNLVVTICTTTFNVKKNYAFCEQNAGVCFAWILQYTASTALFSMNWLVFIIETECSYCAVRTEYIMQFNLNLLRVNLETT